MEQEKDVSEYLQEVNFLELNNNSLWQRVEEAITQLQDIKYVVDMGTDLVNGDSCEPDAGVGVKPDSFDLIFYIQCFRMLEFSFNNDVVRHPIMQKLFAASIEILEQHIDEAMTILKGVYDESTMREKLPLDSIPFLLAKRMRMNFNDVAKDNDIRLSFQALLLFLLRRKIPPKYNTEEAFLQKYPEFSDRSPSERTRLRNTANWMVLTFHTIQPRNNKSFMMHLIPKLIEGKNARYITGSGQTKATADRVHLFRTEGECEKIQRPPRKRKDPSSSDFLAPTSEFAMGTNLATGAAFNGNNLGNNSVLPNLTPNLSVPAIDPIAFQLHLQLLQQQQLLHPRNNNGPVPNTNAMMLSNQIYSALLMQQQANFANNNTNAASNNVNGNAFVSNYAALYAAALQKASLNLANSSAAATMNNSNKRNYQNHSTLQQFQHVSQDSLSSADGLSSGAPSPTHLTKKKSTKHSNNVSAQNKSLQSYPLATTSSSIPINTAAASAPNATAGSSGLSHQPNLFLQRSASVNDIPQVGSSSLFLSDEAMLSSTEAPILKRAKTAHNLDLSGKNAANSHAASSFRSSLTSFYPSQTLPFVTSSHTLLSSNPLTHSSNNNNGLNGSNLFVNPSLYQSSPLSATTSSQSLSSTLSSPFLFSLSIGQQPPVFSGTSANDLSAIKFSLLENSNNPMVQLKNSRLSMMQHTHNNSNSSMGLDALLSAAECLEEYPSIA